MNPPPLLPAQDMVRRGCERNVITYSSLISACEKAGRWELALELFREMHTEGCRPNVVTYNSLIAACAQGERGVGWGGVAGGGGGVKGRMGLGPRFGSRVLPAPRMALLRWRTVQSADNLAVPPCPYPTLQAPSGSAPRSCSSRCSTAGASPTR